MDTFKKGQKTTLIAGGGTIFFAILKAIVGVISGSVVLVADAIHSGADAFGTFLAWVGLKISQKDPTEKFPYGFYKAENIASLIISFLIFYAGFNMVRQSIGKLTGGVTELDIALIAIISAILDGLIMFAIGTYEVKSGREIDSQSLVADGTESRLHLLSSGVVLVGLLGTYFGVPYLEGIAGLIISIFIFEAGWDSFKDAIFVLMDRSPSSEIETKIGNILDKISGVDEFEGLKLRKSGPYIFGEASVKIKKDVNVQKADEISSSIQDQIKEEIDKVDSFSVKISSHQTSSPRVAIPITEKRELNSKIASKFGRTDYFIFLETNKEEIKDFEIKENPHKDEEVRAGLKTAQWVVEHKIDTVVTPELGPVSLHTLKDHIVDVYKSQKKDIKENIKKLSAQKLDRLKEPTKER